MKHALLAALLFSQAGLASTVAWYAIIAIVIVGVVAIVVVVVKHSGITIPSWAISILWILVITIVAILAIKLLLQVAL